MQDTSSSGSPGPQPSALLPCLSQLNADTWAQVLLPKLVEQGSAAAFALSCSQLRDLCYSSRQSLNLGALLDSTDPWSLRSQVQNLPMHFPNCSAVSLDFTSNNCHHTMPCLLPELARLPHLNGLSISFRTKLEPLLVSTMLYSMRTQLPGLQGLTLAVKHPGSWMAADDVHRELGELTQLTWLCLDFQNLHVRNPSKYPGMQCFSALKQLQHLAIWADWDEDLSRYEPGFDADWPDLPAQLLPALTSLTRLESNLFDVPAVADLSSCVNLQHLAICSSCGKQQLCAHVQMGSADWAGLAALTRLTELRLMNVCMLEASPEACEAFSKLTRLQVAAAFEWSQDFLPALTACARLTEICGTWEWPRQSSEPVVHTLPQVLLLSAFCGLEPDLPPRYECFPNLRRLRQDVLSDGRPSMHVFGICPSDLHLLCKHCTGLEERVLTAETSSLLPEIEHEEDVNTVAAVQSLTSLKHLTRLAFTPHHDHERLALVQACRVLEGHSLQELHWSEGGWGDQLITPALVLLGQLRQLRKLSVQFTSQQMCEKLVDHAEVFLSALAGCDTVVLQLRGPTEPFERALAALREAGLPAPRVVCWGE